MPVTAFQKEIIKLLIKNKSEAAHLAGGSAINFEPQTVRFSQDIDYFHDTAQDVEKTFRCSVLGFIPYGMRRT